MKAKKFLSLLLCALMLLGSVSCSETNTTEEETTANETTANAGETVAETEETKEFLDDIPEGTNYGGLSVRYLASFRSNSIALLEEDDESEIVNEAVWKRNQLMEERLGLKTEIATGATTGYDKFNGIVKQSVQAQSDDIDILAGHTRFNINLASDGILKNLQNVDHLDFSKPYWSQGYNESISYKGNYYWATGDLSLDYIKFIYCMFVNSAMWADHYPDVNIYDIVKEGKWTLDTLMQYAENTYVDSNGDGVFDNGDTYGIKMQKGHILNGMFFASNVEYTGYDEEGTPSVILNSEHTINVFNKLHQLFYGTSYGMMMANGEYENHALEVFPARKLLFAPLTFEFAEKEQIRDMEDNFFIIPMPKFDENQENYRSGQYDGVPIYGITITANEENMAAYGASLEAMCSMSSQMVLPVYFDKALKNKYSRDAETADMIDLIRASVDSDFSFAWGDTVGNIYNIFYDNIQNDAITSQMKSYSKLWTRTMSKLLDTLDENALN